MKGVRRAIGHTEGLHYGAMDPVREEPPEDGIDGKESGDDFAKHSFLVLWHTIFAGGGRA